MKNIKYSTFNFLILSLVFTFFFQSCDNSFIEDDIIGQARIATTSTPPAVCKTSDNFPSSCDTQVCDCPTLLVVSQLTGAISGAYINISKSGNGPNLMNCYLITATGQYCLNLEGGGANRNQGTTYEISIAAPAGVDASATISLTGSCSNDGDIVDYELTDNFFWTQWHCLAQTQDL